jgi:hypothetical protein
MLRPPGVARAASGLFVAQVLQRRVLQRQFGEHSLELGVLRLQLLDPLKLRGIESTVLGLPLLVGRRTDAVLPTYLGNRPPGLRFLQDRDDLRLRES